MKIIFMGTPAFAVPGLRLIRDAGIEIGAVITRPDRKAGRRKRLTAPAVKEAARELDCEVLQPGNLREDAFLARVKEIAPRLFVVSAYGRFIPRSFLKLAPEAGINLHPSLLPRYRGAAPIQWALINGETETGVSVIAVADRMDAGDIYGQRKVEILPGEKADELSRRLAVEGGELLVEVIEAIEKGRARPVPQDESRVTTAPRLEKKDARIDWTIPADAICNRFRGMYPWPGTETSLDTGKGTKLLKIHGCRPVDGDGPPGSVLEAGGDRLIVAAGTGAVRIDELQLEGRRALPVDNFLRGNPLEKGSRLGTNRSEDR